ncbi:MAG TPA: DUF4215 domain-containing protein [Candidatus Eisenbacteria bacterium]|nr:DUF4215 domain-containing protein [Candidatus Eisenbacteria bacterium]
MPKLLAPIVLALATHTALMAADQPIAGTRLTLKRSNSGTKLVFVSKDPAFLFPAFASGDDPSVVGATLDVISAAEGAAALAIPAGVGKPGWETKTTSPAYRFANKTAPAGPSPVRLALLKQGRLLRMVARDVGLPLATAHGAVGIRLTTGTVRSCALFNGATIRVDLPGRFVASGAISGALADCSDAALGATTTSSTTTSSTSTSTPTTTVPVCGNGIIEAGEQCDGAAGGSCAPLAPCGAPGTPAACQCCASTGSQCGFQGGPNAPCCDATAACVPICAPEFPAFCQTPSTFAGCNMTGTWYFFDDPSSRTYSIVEGAGGALSVVSFVYPDFATYQVATGMRMGAEVELAPNASPLFQESCDSATGGLCINLVRATPSVCGDGTIDAALQEECDDGNQLAGDCCSPTCRIEPGCP